MTPTCTKTCNACGYEGEVFTNSKKCPKCGEMTLTFDDVTIDEEDVVLCDTSLDDEKSSCVIHKCRLHENHEMKGGELDDLHECICGKVWRDDNNNLKKRWEDLDMSKTFGMSYEEFDKMTEDAINDFAKKNPEFAKFIGR